MTEEEIITYLRDRDYTVWVESPLYVAHTQMGASITFPEDHIVTAQHVDTQDRLRATGTTVHKALSRIFEKVRKLEAK